MKTVCIVPGCPELTVPGGRGRCVRHRLSTAGRGYGPRHGAARQRLAATLPALCAYGCGTMLQRDRLWVAAHVVDGDETRGWVAACPSCNERAKHGRLQPAADALIVNLDDTPRVPVFA